MKREESRGHNTQPCGTPVFRVIVEEERLPNLTAWGLLVRKSIIQLQSELLSLEISLEGITVLIAELN